MTYIRVAETPGEDEIELPIEDDGTLLLTTVTAQFPRCTGLKYKTSSGTTRGLRLDNGKIYPPAEGWEENSYICVLAKDAKRKFNSETEMDTTDEVSSKLKRLEGKKCTDLIVLNLAWRTDENELRRYFSTFGDLVTVQVKRDAQTHQSKGYGFIRFLKYESQLLCLTERHFIDGRWCDVKVPMSKAEGDKQEVSRKIHVGRLSSDITVSQLQEVFARYGRVIDVFVPKPFRSFAFVTFEDPEVAANLLGKEVPITAECTTLIGSAVPKLPPANQANQKQMAIAMQAAACVAALNHAGGQFGSGPQGEHPCQRPPPPPQHHHHHQPAQQQPPPSQHQQTYPQCNFNFPAMFNLNQATAAVRATEYTMAQRQNR